MRSIPGRAGQEWKWSSSKPFLALRLPAFRLASLPGSTELNAGILLCGLWGSRCNLAVLPLLVWQTEMGLTDSSLPARQRQPLKGVPVWGRFKSHHAFCLSANMIIIAFFLIEGGTNSPHSFLPRLGQRASSLVLLWPGRLLLSGVFTSLAGQIPMGKGVLGQHIQRQEK